MAVRGYQRRLEDNGRQLEGDPRRSESNRRRLEGGGLGGGGGGGGSAGGCRGGFGCGGGGGSPRWGDLRTTHYYHMHTSRGDVKRHLYSVPSC